MFKKRKTSAVEALNDFVFTVPYFKTIPSAIPAEQNVMNPVVTCSRMSELIFFVSVQLELYLKEPNAVCFFILQQIKEMLTMRTGFGK